MDEILTQDSFETQLTKYFKQSWIIQGDLKISYFKYVEKICGQTKNWAYLCVAWYEVSTWLFFEVVLVNSLVKLWQIVNKNNGNIVNSPPTLRRLNNLDENAEEKFNAKSLLRFLQLNLAERNTPVCYIWYISE